jgi:hypothetical protein
MNLVVLKAKKYSSKFLKMFSLRVEFQFLSLSSSLIPKTQLASKLPTMPVRYQLNWIISKADGYGRANSLNKYYFPLRGLSLKRRRGLCIAREWLPALCLGGGIALSRFCKNHLPLSLSAGAGVLLLQRAGSLKKPPPASRTPPH